MLFKLVLVIGIATFAHAKSAKFIGVGFGVFDSSSTSIGIDFLPLTLGVKNQNAKIYLGMSHLLSSPNSATHVNDALFVSTYAFNYDYLFDEFGYVLPYVGAGLSWNEVEYFSGQSSQIIDKHSSFGFEMQTGIEYYFDKTVNLNIGLQYLQVNSNWVHHIYGVFIYLELNKND